MSPKLIQWYPGHIAKAEKQLNKNIQKVDLIIEVRDARIPLSTSHPSLNKWVHNKKHILVINRRDMISTAAIEEWDEWFKMQGVNPFWCDAKTGKGVQQLQIAAVQSGQALNHRRHERGMKPRAVRALTLGFPNVGKSALINRLMRKKIVSSSRRPGVTRSLRWIRIGQDLDLLDAPGVLPTRIDDQESAVKLALCDDIGQASYEMELVAIELLELINELKNNTSSGISINILENRYGVAFKEETNSSYNWLASTSNIHTSGDTRRMSHKLLDDFRKNFLGLISLELPSTR